MSKFFKKSKVRLKKVVKQIYNGSPDLVTKKLQAGNLKFNIDNPKATYIDTKTIVVEGWLLGAPQEYDLRILNEGKSIPVNKKLKRPDVLKAYPLEGDNALYSGFSSTFEYENGIIELQVLINKKCITLYKSEIYFAPEKSFKSILNPNLAENYAEHEILLDNTKQYYFENSVENVFMPNNADIRLMAFYLPQFHPIAENDKVWGRGFTEWTNVTAAKPRFTGHQQPILPADLGFYDLRLESNIKEQIEIATKHGIHGFVYYYYWFSGKKILNKPIESFISHKEWDFNFAICWANENWTKRWDGRENDVIIAQKYLESDPLDFIKDVEDVLNDSRYVNYDGKPVLIVYRASELKNPKNYAEVWRKYFKDKHNKELYLISVISFEDTDPRVYGFDAAIEFNPLSSFFKTDAFPGKSYPYLDMSQSLMDINFSGTVADYRKIALNPKLDSYYDFPTFKCVTPSWDNDARKKGKGFVFYNNSPDIYATWLDRVVSIEKSKKKQQLVFVNAWNEWAEGAILEPSQHLGSAFLNRTTEVLAKHSKNPSNKEKFPVFKIRKNKNAELAVIVHLYHVDAWTLILDKLEIIRKATPFDLFVTIGRKDEDFAETIAEFDNNAQVVIVPNRGRDVLPFVVIARRLKLAGYSKLLKLHSKKSLHREDGNEWFKDLLDSLVPSENSVKNIVKNLDSGKTLIGPRGHYLSLEKYMGGESEMLIDMVSNLKPTLNEKTIQSRISRTGFFGGTMFWATFEAVESILNAHLLPSDFASEKGQIVGTRAHVIERAFGLIANLEESTILEIGKDGKMSQVDSPLEVYKYAK